MNADEGPTPQGQVGKNENRQVVAFRGLGYEAMLTRWAEVLGSAVVVDVGSAREHPHGRVQVVGEVMNARVINPESEAVEGEVMSVTVGGDSGVVMIELERDKYGGGTVHTDEGGGFSFVIGELAFSVRQITPRQT